METKNTVRKNIFGVYAPAKYHITDYHLDSSTVDYSISLENSSFSLIAS